MVFPIRSALRLYNEDQQDKSVMSWEFELGMNYDRVDKSVMSQEHVD